MSNYNKVSLITTRSCFSLITTRSCYSLITTSSCYSLVTIRLGYSLVTTRLVYLQQGFQHVSFLQQCHAIIYLYVMLRVTF